MNVAILSMSIVACAASLATLTVVLVGAKRAEAKMADIEQKATSNVNKLKNAIINLDI